MGELSGNALKVAESRYLQNGESWQDRCKTIARSIASVEKDSKQYEDKFGAMIYDMDFLPGGRILRNAGKPRGNLFNCFNIPIQSDSIEAIGQFYKEILIVWKYGGGIGVNISNLRPSGAPILGVGGENGSSGPVSFLIASNAIAKTVESGGSRRAAGLCLMSVKHPDIYKYIDAKLKQGELSHYNISVGVTEEFLTAVEQDSEWNLRFAQKLYKTVPAKELWDKIVTNMLLSAEPGIINMDNLMRNNSYSYAPISCCNACTEVPLENHGLCLLGSIVLPNHISNINTNWVKLSNTIETAVRFLDNVTDVSSYVLEPIKIRAYESRRLGIGVMGLSEYLFAKKIRYGSEKAIGEIERLMKFIRDRIYEELVKLSIEKGAFPRFNPVDYGKAHFIRTLPASLRMDIKKYGTRCVTGIAIAPTGTISLLPEVTSGIEPLFMKAYKRNDRISERIYVHPLYENIIKERQPTPDWFVDTTDLTPQDHLNTQATCQKYTDGAISKTINLPSGYSKDKLSALLLEYLRDLKGVTVYCDGSREGQVLNKITKKELLEHLKLNETSSSIDEDLVSCNTGTCEL